MNTDSLILTIVYQANVIRTQAEEIAQLRRLLAELAPPKAPEPAAPKSEDAAG